MEFSPEGFKDLDVSRLEIFYSALKIMLLRPLVGVGAASFTAIYELQNNFWKGHSHNLIIELGISYGIPVALILFFTISKLLYLSCIEIFKNNKNIEYFERAWWASIFFFLISQLVDIQYFDAKISIIFWSLLAGLRNIIKKNIENSNLREFT